MAALVRAMAGSREAAGRPAGVKGEALAAATAADLAVASAPTVPAIERYTGVLYSALDADSLPAAPRRRIDARCGSSPGCGAWSRPGDPIPDYKLKMGATLPPAPARPGVSRPGGVRP